MQLGSASTPLSRTFQYVTTLGSEVQKQTCEANNFVTYQLHLSVQQYPTHAPQRTTGILLIEIAERPTRVPSIIKDKITRIHKFHCDAF